MSLAYFAGFQEFLLNLPFQRSDPAPVRLAVRMRQKADPKIELEVSGGIRLENVRDYALTGVERISVGALTHSAPSLDVALDIVG